MAQFRTVLPDMWDDDWLQSLDDKPRLFFLYLITNHSTTPSGLYKLSSIVAGAVLKCSQPSLLKFQTAFESKGAAYFKDGWVFVSNFVERQPIPNERIWHSIVLQIHRAPKPLLRRWLQKYASQVPQHLRKHSPTVDQLNTTETETETRQRLDKDKEERKEQMLKRKERKAWLARTELAALDVLGEQSNLVAKWPTLQQSLRDAYPALDITAEVYRAEAFLVANPKKRYKRYGAFLRNWMAKAERIRQQDAGEESAGFPT